MILFIVAVTCLSVQISNYTTGPQCIEYNFEESMNESQGFSQLRNRDGFIYKDTKVRASIFGFYYSSIDEREIMLRIMIGNETSIYGKKYNINPFTDVNNYCGQEIDNITILCNKIRLKYRGFRIQNDKDLSTVNINYKSQTNEIYKIGGKITLIGTLLPEDHQSFKEVESRFQKFIF